MPRKPIKRSNGYDALAVHAAKEAGLREHTPEAAALDGKSRAYRDGLWAEYDRRLRDEATYTVDALWEWLKEYGADVGRNTPWRDRNKLLERERRVELAGKQTAAVLDRLDKEGLEDLLRGGRSLAAQLLFNAFLNFPAEALVGMDTDQFIRAVTAITKLSKADVDAALGQARLAEMERKVEELRERTDAAAKTKADGRLGREDVYRIIDEVMKGDAA